MVRQLTLLQSDPIAAIAPNADLVASSRLGSSYSPGELDTALADRMLLELRAMIRPSEDLALYRADMVIERSFGQTRRRAKVIGRFPGETSCLSLVWAVLDRACAGWLGLTMTPAGLRLLQDLRHQLLDRPTACRRRHNSQHARPVTATRPETVPAVA